MTPLLANLGSPTHWFILFVLVLIVFGAKRLPDIARNLGKGLAEFKKARKEFEKELNKVDADEKSQDSDSQQK
ncbi:MAG: twin-arginine translocase TatA/TatE family subunit [Akkermansia sp.]|nr:twin-arginine translocase TatA/TatE family subunit [Akkermansiaceae bacterium]MBR1997421.1 twin-arginine translocase TatA/TatE family subunit [Akkermansia sp.]MBR3695806.1 twin-arginine translocase TatA/TatE family subunit [Akkermansia sp.]